MKPPELRLYQSDVLERGRAEIEKGARSLLFCMPTGTGKTRTAIAACVGHVMLGGVPMFVAPRRELVMQATAELENAGLEPGHDCFVRTIQELTSKSALVPPATMVVLDEARHYVADEWSRLHKALPEATYLGLDATPERGDGKGLGRANGGIFDVLLEAISVKDAVAQGYLVPCEVVRPEKPLGLDFAQDPFDAWWDHADGESTVIFCHSVAEAKKLAQRFYDRGIPAAAVWGDMPTAERDNAIQLFNEGKLQVLTNMHLLTEGWDAPRTGCVMLASSCPTAGGYLQRVGRGMRPFPGKKRMILIDLPGVSHHHGEPDDERRWHLDGLACRRAASPEVRFCPVCGAPTTTKECTKCGYAGDQMKKRKPRVLGLPMDRFARQRAASDEEKAKALAGYLAAARRKGHQRWWAFKAFEGVYGVKPSAQLKTMAMRVFLSK